MIDLLYIVPVSAIIAAVAIIAALIALALDQNDLVPMIASAGVVSIIVQAVL